MLQDADRTLPRARDTDPVAQAEAFLTTDETWRFEHVVDHHRTLCARAGEAAAPVILEMARRLRLDGPATAADGTVARFVPFPDPWRLGVALERPGTEGHLFAVGLDVPVTASQAVQQRLANMSLAHRMRLRETGLTGEDLDRAVIGAEVVDEMELEERMLREGYPSDLPDPDTFTEIASLQLCRYAVEDEAPREGEAFGAFAARMRLAQAPGLDTVVAGIVGETHAPGEVFRLRPAFLPFEGAEVYGSGSISEGAKVMHWPDAFSKLASAVAATGLGDALTSSADEVSSRVYRTYHSKPEDIAIHAMGQAMAVMDDGLPGARARALAGSFATALATRTLSARTEDIVRFVDLLVDGGHVGPSAAFVWNDLDDTAWIEDAGVGSMVRMTDQNGAFAVFVERDATGGLSRVAMARYGKPLDEYLDHNGAKAWGRVEADEDFLRDYANPDDPHAPLPIGQVSEALIAGRGGFPGFLGRYGITSDGLTCEEGGAWGRNAQADANLLCALFEYGRIGIEAERASPTP